MDILGIPIDDWWEQAIAVYFAGCVPAWFACYRGCTEWQVKGEAVVRKYKESDSPAAVFWLGVFWPIVAPIVVIFNTLDALGGSTLLNGKPPKKLVAEAHEKKVTRLLNEDTEAEEKPKPKAKPRYSVCDTDY